MTPDLSAAFLRCKDILTSPGFVDVENASPECVADLLLIAREWAKTIREDDEFENITKEWLLSIGFANPNPAATACFDSPIAECGCVRIRPKHENGRVNLVSGTSEWLLMINATRGDVKRICHALGIPLKESRP